MSQGVDPGPPTSSRARVAGLLEQRRSVGEIARQLGVSKPTVCYHARRLDHPPSVKYDRRYDWAEVQRFYDAGKSVRECRRRFGFANQTWNDAVERGDVVPRPRGLPIATLLVAGRTGTSRHSLKRRLLGAGLKHDRCEECGLSESRARELSLALHHVNGDRHDNRLENLAFLCPNCHSQTENFAGRNRTRGPSGPRSATRAAAAERGPGPRAEYPADGHRRRHDGSS